MPDVSIALNLGPGLMGLGLGFVVYGVALGQYGFYLRTFSVDRRALKALVFLVFVMDTLHTYGMAGYNWVLVIFCRHDTSRGCPSTLPWEAIMAAICSYSITFVVQSFYAYRLWIISGRNKLITGTVLATALAQIVLGMMCMASVIRTGSPTAERITLVIASSAAGMSTICDSVITVCIFFYLQPKRSGIKRAGTAIQQLIDVSIQTGLLTCLISLAVFILMWIYDGQYWLNAFAPVFCKSYVNSLLAVLNARKSMREAATKTIELSTIAATQISTADTPSSTNSSRWSCHCGT
ncbi:hypothetical protein BV22DRAFT_340740 [Leucogyrophana mollusca]|uniref:Uncharacterized protein n=1 Tax=Leucogyrophana mollusca TaxID=85980 RepID=A0ACB8BLW2_9AGAM|nr:hypothetical protein BV22DRAFT_340740 [Leucogyrophana mollusca]